MNPRLDGKVPNNDDVIHELARNTQRPVAEVKVVYERQMASLEADAKVTTYLPVLAKRRARDELNRRH